MTLCIVFLAAVSGEQVFQLIDSGTPYMNMSSRSTSATVTATVSTPHSPNAQRSLITDASCTHRMQNNK